MIDLCVLWFGYRGILRFSNMKSCEIRSASVYIDKKADLEIK